MVESLAKSDGKIKDRLEGIIIEMIEKGIIFPDAVNHFEKQYIIKVLKKNKGNIRKTADALGMHRNTLSKKMERYRLAQGSRPVR